LSESGFSGFSGFSGRWGKKSLAHPTIKYLKTRASVLIKDILKTRKIRKILIQTNLIVNDINF
jgi:hypothetical protein